jgi:putative transposase
MCGGAVIVDKYPRAVDGTPVPLRSTGVPSTAESVSEVPAEAKPGQRRPAALDVECVA